MKTTTGTSALAGFIMALGICAVGCEASGDVQVIDVGNNRLNIRKIEIERTAPDGDRLLTVRGLNAEGQEVAGATVRTGSVMYSSDTDIGPPHETTGRELIVWAGDNKAAPLVVPNLAPFQMQEPWTGSIAEFVALQPVASALATAGKLSFTLPPSDSGESGYNAASCSGTTFPTTKGNSSQCCVEGGIQYFLISTGTLGERANGLACSNDGVNHSNCTGTNCSYGPCGSYLINPGGTGSNAHVFHPTTGDAHCGRDDNASIHYPEAYTTQTLWTGVTAGCALSQCCYSSSLGYSLPYVGSGCNILTATSTDDGVSTGTISTSPAAINFFDPGTGAAGFADNQVVTVYAAPQGTWALAHISGGCSSNPAHGVTASCNVTMGTGGSTASVAVSFTCTSGKSCPF